MQCCTAGTAGQLFEIGKQEAGFEFKGQGHRGWQTTKHTVRETQTDTTAALGHSSTGQGKDGNRWVFQYAVRATYNGH